MKKIYPFSILVLLILNGCSLNDIDNDLYRINTFGKVKSIRERAYIANKENGKISIGSQIVPSGENHSFYKEFNKKGLLLEYISYDENDIKKLSYSREYDSDDKILKEKHYDSQGKLANTLSYIYSGDQLQAIFSIKNDDTTSRLEYYYDDQGLLILTKDFSHERLTHSTEWIITGNDTSKIVEKTTTFSDGDDQIYEKEITELGKIVFSEFEIRANPSRITISTSYTYSELGNLIEKYQLEKRWLFGSITERNSTYTYDDFDKNNNWHSMYSYLNNVLGNYIEREIEYY